MLGLPFAFWTAKHLSSPGPVTLVHRWFFGLAHWHDPPVMPVVCVLQRSRILGLPFAFWTAKHLSSPGPVTLVHRWFFFFFLPSYVERQMPLFLQALGFRLVHSFSVMVGTWFCAAARLSRQSAARIPSRTATTA